MKKFNSFPIFPIHLPFNGSIHRHHIHIYSHVFSICFGRLNGWGLKRGKSTIFTYKKQHHKLLVSNELNNASEWERETWVRTFHSVGNEIKEIQITAIEQLVAKSKQKIDLIHTFGKWLSKKSYISPQIALPDSLTPSPSAYKKIKILSLEREKKIEKTDNGSIHMNKKLLLPGARCSWR